MRFYRMETFRRGPARLWRGHQADPENVAAIINRGDTYSRSGSICRSGAKDYRAAVRLGPKMGTWPIKRGLVHGHLPRRSTTATTSWPIEAAERAIEFDGADYRNLSTLAAAQASAGLFKEAKATQEKAIAKAAKGEVLTAEKMMSLYQREIAYRDRPITAFDGPEMMDENDVQQAAASEPIDGAPQQESRAVVSGGQSSFVRGSEPTAGRAAAWCPGTLRDARTSSAAIAAARPGSPAVPTSTSAGAAAAPTSSTRTPVWSKGKNLADLWSEDRVSCPKWGARHCKS